MTRNKARYNEYMRFYMRGYRAKRKLIQKATIAKLKEVLEEKRT